MDGLEILKLLTDAPLSLVLLYLFIRAQKELAEVRAARDADNARTFERVAGLVEKVTAAINELTFKA